MNTQFLTSASAVVLGLVLLTGCDKQAADPAAVAPTPVAPVTEEAAQTQTEVAVVQAGGLTATAVVEKSTDESPEAFVASTRVESLTGKVLSINHETREVVLVGENGVELKVIADESAKNITQVSVGDTVNAQVVEQITIELVKGGGLPALETGSTSDVQAAEGQMPVREKVTETVKVYTVEAINLENNTFKLKNVAGEVTELTAQNPANLTKAAVGDAVVITMTESKAVEVIKATK